MRCWFVWCVDGSLLNDAYVLLLNLYFPRMALWNACRFGFGLFALWGSQITQLDIDLFRLKHWCLDFHQLKSWQWSVRRMTAIVDIRWLIIGCPKWMGELWAMISSSSTTSKVHITTRNWLIFIARGFSFILYVVLLPRAGYYPYAHVLAMVAQPLEIHGSPSSVVNRWASWLQPIFCSTFT